MDKEMQRALEADGEKLRQLTGEDHGPFDIPGAPEMLVDCPHCCGQGYFAQTIQVYERGCGFPHDDVEERPCEHCLGLGFLIDDADGDFPSPQETAE